MTEQRYHDRLQLHWLLQVHPEWPLIQVARVLHRSYSWVKTWRQRVGAQPLVPHQSFLDQPRTPRVPLAAFSQQVIDRVLTIRDHPPGNLRRTPGPKAIQ